MKIKNGRVNSLEGLAEHVNIVKTARVTRKLFSKCIGILFVYVILFSILRDYIFFPVARKLWSLSLMTVKEGYISEQNITAIFTHPLVLMSGLFTIAGYCIVCLWETAGITMILEYSYREQYVRLLNVIIMSFRQIRHCLNPKNWLIFVYLVIVQPLIDSDFAAQTLSDIEIPEFIMDFIGAKTVLSIIYAIVIFALLFLFIRFLFVPVIMILEKSDFKQAAIKSAGYMQGRYISTYVKIMIAAVIGSALLRVVPYGIMYLMQATLVEIFKGYKYVYDISAYVFDELLYQVLGTFKTVFVKIFVTAMLLIVYHVFDSQLDIESEISLPKECVKKEGKIRSFKGFVYLAYLVMFAAAFIMFASLAEMSESDPLTVVKLVNPTKIAAHKGYSSKAPENTMPAFELASKCEIVDYIELDVRETKDGIPVVIHDASVLAATGENISIYDITYDELQKLNATYGYNDAEYQDTKISSLDDVLNKYVDKANFIIEIKASKNTPQLPQKIVALMEKYGITDTSMIHSGSYESLKAVKDINPDIKCGFIIAVSMGGYEDLPYADFFSVEHTYISKNVISQIHKRGKEVYVWTVNEKSSFNQVRSMGADALITDYPEDAYEGIHKYDADLMDKLYDVLNVPDLDEIENAENNSGNYIDYNGTGD